MNRFILFGLSFCSLFLFAFVPRNKPYEPEIQDKYKYEVAIGMVFQNEASYLKEWIEFHKLVGVQHFYLYNNNSTDNYLEVLQEYVERGEVELTEWPTHNNTWHAWCFVSQPKIYLDAVNKARGVAKWLAIVDSDEFLFPSTEQTLIKCLDRHFKDAVGVYVNWQLFGTSSVPRVSENKLMIESLVMKAPQNYKGNRDCKSIFRPEFVKDCSCPHYMKYQKGFKHVNGKGDPTGIANVGVFVDTIRINHYWCRDEHFLYNEKIPRYDRFRNPAFKKDVAGTIEKKIIILNQVYDDNILRFVPDLRARMGLE